MSKQPLNLFDFDKTLIVCDSMIPFLCLCVGPWKVLLALVELAKNYPTLKKCTDRGGSSSSIRAFAKEILLGASIKSLEPESLPNYEFSELIYRHAFNNAVLRELTEAKQRKERTIIISASIDTYLKPIAERLGVELIATKVATTGNGLLTGSLLGENCRGLEKIKRLEELLDLQNYSPITAYGDSEGDREMLQMATVARYRSGRDLIYPFRSLFQCFRLYLACLIRFYARKLPGHE